MKNFPIIKDGKEYWIARNMAVACFVFTSINNEWHILANKRGPGVSDYKGFWNCPCGYLDYNETTEQAAIREVFEETGVKLNHVEFWKFNDSPHENKQNVTFDYYSIISDPRIIDINNNSKDRGGEANEVKEVTWIPVKKLFDYDWAFDHDLIVTNLIKTLALS